MIPRRIFPIALIVLALASQVHAAQQLSLDEVNKLITEKYPSILHVTPKNLNDWLQPDSGKEVILLDIREEDEFKISHIQGAKRAINIDSALLALFGKPKNTIIVTYDTVGLRAAAIADKLTKRDFGQVYNLDGGIFAWANEGFPLYNDSKQVHKVHPGDLWWRRYLHEDLRAW